MNDEGALIAINTILQGMNLLLTQQRRTSSYLARQEVKGLLGEISQNQKRLEPYGLKVYSQSDEDGIIAEIFRRLDVSAGSFCEIGVGDGLECNTLYLLHKGWRGAWVEADPDRQAPIETKFGDLMRSERLAVAIGYATPDNVDELLANILQSIDVDPADLDFLSIDVDGMDIYLLEALSHRPKVICIEYNAKFPPPLSKKPVFDGSYTWGGTDYMGSSLVALNDAARGKGYTLVATNITGVNAFFVRSDLLNDEFDRHLALEELYNPPRYYLYYDHYSGEVGHRADFGPYEDLTVQPAP